MATKTHASEYDPAKGGINGSPNAAPCGVQVSQVPWSIAHKTLPCGTIVTIVRDNGDSIAKAVRTVVADRGPYVSGRDLDLRPDVMNALGGGGLVQVEYSATGHLDLRKFAAAGGTEAAFKQLTGKDPGVNTSTAQGVSDTLASAGIPNPLSALSDVVKALFDASTYLRLGKGLLGGVLIVLGTGAVVFLITNKVGGSSVGKAATAAVL